MKAATAFVNGTSIYYRDVGSGDEVVVLLIFFPETGDAFAPVVAELGRHFRLIVPDMRRRSGKSPPPVTGYDKRTVATDIRDLLDRIGIDRAHVVGYDLGARVAFSFRASVSRAGQEPDGSLGLHRRTRRYRADEAIRRRQPANAAFRRVRQGRRIGRPISRQGTGIDPRLHEFAYESPAVRGRRRIALRGLVLSAMQACAPPSSTTKLSRRTRHSSRRPTNRGFAICPRLPPAARARETGCSASSMPPACSASVAPS